MNNKRKILIIDDEKSIRQSFFDYFEDREWQPYEAESGERGLEIMEKIKPQYALVDIRLGGMNGDVFIKKAHLINPGTFFIICTGSPEYHTVSDLSRISQLSKRIFLKPSGINR